MKRGGDQKLYVALVTPGSSAGVKYRHGVALVSSFSRAMWVPLSVTNYIKIRRPGQTTRPSGMAAGAVFSVPQKSFGMMNYFYHLSAKKVGLYASHNFVTSLLVDPITCKIYVRVTVHL